MKHRYYGGAWWALVLLMVLALPACTATVRLQEDLADYERRIERLQRRLINNPGDAEALRDLGVIYVRTRNLTQGNEFLQQAYARDANDAKTLFYLGLASEMLGRRDTALRLYEQEVSVLSTYRRLLRGRAEQLRRLAAREQVLASLVQEGQGETPTSPRIVAVFPLTYRGDNNRYAPLGRGLSEMVITDLANVSSLTLVERVRLQALLDELKLAESEYVDPSTAPRSGRLLGAGRIIGGTYAVQRGNLNVDMALITSEDAASRSLETTSGDLDDLFDLEKQVVFRLLDEMGIELTPVEQERIDRVPTRNLQAFLAYSRALQEEDAGRYSAAATLFRQAAALDPAFELATERAETAEGMEATAGTAEEVLVATATLDPPGRELDLVGNRLQQLNNTLSGLFVPGENTREAAQEGTTPLGGPPSPPGQ